CRRLLVDAVVRFACASLAALAAWASVNLFGEVAVTGQSCVLVLWASAGGLAGAVVSPDGQLLAMEHTPVASRDAGPFDAGDVDTILSAFVDTCRKLSDA